MPKKYTHEMLSNAVVSNLNSKAAAIDFNVPARTIRQHWREPNLNVRAGRPSCLTSDQENHFVSLLKLLQDYGFDLTKDLALQLAADYFKSRDLTTQPGSKWLDYFVSRHSEDIIWKKQQKLERIRAEVFTEQTRVGWSATLKGGVADATFSIF